MNIWSTSSQTGAKVGKSCQNVRLDSNGDRGHTRGELKDIRGIQWLYLKLVALPCRCWMNVIACSSINNNCKGKIQRIYSSLSVASGSFSSWAVSMLVNFFFSDWRVAMRATKASYSAEVYVLLRRRATLWCLIWARALMAGARLVVMTTMVESKWRAEDTGNKKEDVNEEVDVSKM